MRRITKQKSLKLGKVPKVGDIISTRFSKEIAVITGVKWMSAMGDYGVTFMFLDTGEQKALPLKYVNLE